MSATSRPWYREPWPWLLMAGPAAVLVAGAATIWLAVASADGLVAEDYYRQGLAINKVLAREDEAKRLGVTARVELGQDAIRVHLRGQSPEALFVRLAHATRADQDQRLRLARGERGVYEAPLEALAPGRWHIIVEDPRATWRAVDSQVKEAR